jgi:hypothetical protein
MNDVSSAEDLSQQIESVRNELGDYNTVRKQPLRLEGRVPFPSRSLIDYKPPAK